MPRIHNLVAGLAFLTHSISAIPFLVQEECFCQPTHPELTSEYHNETLAACSQVATKLQISRAAARRLPLEPEVWLNGADEISLAEHTQTTQLNDNENQTPYAVEAARRKGTFEAAMASISNLASNRARHQHAAQTLPPHRRNSRPASIREQELRRRGLSKEEYRIICRGIAYQPSTPPTPSGEHKHAMTLYIGFRPIPVLFIFLAMVLACTTIIEWALDTWMRYASRIRLEGREQPLYASVGTAMAHEGRPQERTGEVDVEKRAEAQDS
jgi:hypothetical protein